MKASEPRGEVRLADACELVQALLDEASVGISVPSAPECERRRGRARALLQSSQVPTAVFAAADREPELVNDAWRALFDHLEARPQLPAGAVARFDEVVTTGQRLHLPELEFSLGVRTAYCAMVLEPRREADRATQVIAVCVDVTDDVLARRLGVAIEAPMWGGDASGHADYFNAAWRTYVGEHTGEWLDPLPPEDRARCVQACADTIRVGTPIVVEARLKRADGDLRWHRVTFASIGPASRWLGSAVDIHEARHMADAQRANQLKDRFLAAVSHELRAPLTTMLLWEKVLRDRDVDEDLRSQALDAVHQSAQLQSRLVGDLLDVSRAISGKLHVDLRNCEIGRVVEDALRAIAPAMGAKHVALEVHLDSTVGIIEGDAFRLRQVFDNLLSNALKFTLAGGKVVVSTRRKNRTVTITVVDTGCGIAEDFLPQLFQAFSQYDNALTRSHGGLGLGLAIARQLVELHGGTLQATSAGLGQGATFTVTLQAAGARRTSTPPPGLRAPALHQVSVLIVDDDRRVRDALAHLLKRAGATATTAESAAVGRERLAETHPAIIICDIAMSAEDGYEFIHKLRATGNSTPAIALTAYATEADAQRARSAGFDVHLTKPIDFDRLVEIINDLIASHASATK